MITTKSKFISNNTFPPRNKFSGSVRFVQATVISPSGISVESQLVQATVISSSGISDES